jgi:hypothetical protein
MNVKRKPMVFDYDCPAEVKQTFSALKHCKEFSWEGHVVTLFYKDEDCQSIISLIKRVLEKLKPTKPLIADLLFTHAKKFYPSDRVFGPPHVNTGYSSDKIVVYRKEEWFKVFIHECFHYYHLEKGLFDESLREPILKLFPVNSTVNLYESYCEMWARTLNCEIISEITCVPFVTLMYHEKKYAVRHMVNVLHHMGLTYQDLRKGCAYQEKTNVLAYVVLTAVLLFKDFIPKHRFKHYQLNSVKEYIHFLERNVDDKGLLLLIQETIPQKTTTMSFYNIENYI